MKEGTDPSKFLISLAAALVNLLVTLILLLALLYLVMVLISDIEGINKLQNLAIKASDIITASRSVIVSLLTISGAAFALSIFVFFIRWLSKDEEGIMIVPFEIAAGKEKFSGKAISDLLTAELLRIQEIHKFEYKEISATRSGNFSERFNVKLAPSSENLTYTISQMGPVGLGTTSIHVGQLMTIVKRLCSWGDNGQIISGSLQRYGPIISLVACMEHHNIQAWEASETEYCFNNEERCIPNLVRDMAFKIVHKLPGEEISAKTWEGFKHYTEALDAYRLYIITEDLKNLERSRINCQKAFDAEVGYQKTSILFYNLGIAYHNLRNSKRSIECYQKAASLNPNSFKLPALYREGLVHINTGNNDLAMQCFDEVLNLDPKHLNAWMGKGVSYDNSKKHEEAVKCFEKCIEIDPNNHYIWYYKGDAEFNLNRVNDSIQSYKNAIKYNPNDIWPHISLIRAYKYSNEETKYAEHCEIARKMIPQIPESEQYARICFHAACGEIDEVLHLLRAMLNKKDKNTVDIGWVKTDPDFESIRKDPKYKERFSALLDEFSSDGKKGPK